MAYNLWYASPRGTLGYAMGFPRVVQNDPILYPTTIG